MVREQHEHMLTSVYAADTDLRELAERLGIGLGELASLAAEPGFVGTVEALASLAEQRSRLLVARYRVNAAARLVALAGQDADAELSRKAAVDLLKLNLPSSAPVSVEVPTKPLDTDAVLGALAAIGAANTTEANAHDSGADTSTG